MYKVVMGMLLFLVALCAYFYLFIVIALSPFSKKQTRVINSDS